MPATFWSVSRAKLKHDGGIKGDELVNRSYRNRAADELGHRDVTSNYPGSGGSKGLGFEGCGLSLSDLTLV